MDQQEGNHHIKPTRSKLKRRILVAGAIFLLFCVAATIFIKYTWKPFVTTKIKEAVSKSTLGLYTVNFSDLDFNILTGNAEFDSLRFEVDTTVLKGLKNKGEAPNHIYNVLIERLSISNIRFSEIYYQKKLHLKAIQIDKPELAILYNDWNTETDSVVKKTAYEQISGFLKSLKIDNINLNDANVKYTDNSDAKPEITKFKGVFVSVDDLKIDSASQYDKTRFYYTKDVSVRMKGHQFTTKNGLYTISFDDVMASSSVKTLKLSKFRMNPLYPEMEFSRKFQTQQDRYDISFSEILLSDIDFVKLNTQRRLIASKLLINGGKVDVFMNRALPPVVFDKGRNYPHMALKRLKLRTRLDSLVIKSTDISYSEYNPKSEKKGTVTFNRLNATIRNVTNDSLSVAANNWASAKTSARLLNTAAINVNINFNLSSANGEFNFDGTIGKFDMRVLNKLTRNMSLAEIESGTINKAEFKVSGNLRSSTGYIKLFYNNLKVNLLKNDEKSDKLEKKGVISTLANALVIKNDNPGDDGVLRVGKTNAERDNSGSFFNLMWKSIFAGIKESVGVTLSEVDKIEVAPSKREKRKMERQLRREKRREEKKK